MLKISIANDFSVTPGPRLKKEGSFSGEAFRESILVPRINEALHSNEKLEINLDGTAGYGTSFLEEAFGGLIRKGHFLYSSISNLIIIITDEEPYLKEDITHYMSHAEPN